MESETVSMNFSYSITLKSTGLSCTLNGSFTYAWFCNIMNWSFGKYWCTEWWRSSKYGHISLYGIKKITFVNIANNLIRETFHYWQAVKCIVASALLQNLNFWLESLKLETNAIGYVLWLDKHTSFIFQKKCAKYTSGNNHGFIYRSFVRVKMVFYTAKAALIHSVPHKSDFPWDCHHSWYVAREPCAYFPSPHTEYYKDVHSRAKI